MFIKLSFSQFDFKQQSYLVFLKVFLFFFRVKQFQHCRVWTFFNVKLNN